MNNFSRFILAVVLAIFLVMGWQYLSKVSHREAAAPYTEVRAAMDIGSGATNMKIAKVDPKTHKIISVIFEQSIPVAYQKHLENSTDMTFDQEVMDQGIKAIKTLKEIADQHQVKKVVAVATAAFRAATNAPAFVKEIEKQTGVQVKIIDQTEEGTLAFEGAIAVMPIDPHKAIVWDIGGGSMQLTALSMSNDYIVEMGTFASIPFKNALIQEIHGKDIKLVQTPNPVRLEDLQPAMALVKREISAPNAYIMEMIRQPGTQVLAVGNLFYHGVRSAAGGHDIATQADIEQGIMQLLGKTDEEIGKGSFSEVAVSNPMMVLGYMKALGIDKIQFVNVNNADGALAYPYYWESHPAAQ